MTINIDTTTVRRSIVVDASIERAFTFFSRDIAAWWDPDKHLLQEPLAEMVFEPFVGGHIIDRGVNGTESCWATVLVFDPPNHLAFSWDIDLSWQIETDPAKRSEVHVTFTAEQERRTLVELEHRHLDRHGEGWEAMRDAVGSPNGWDLEPLARAIAGAG
jgi:Activator of Hsp90 ATPase homolog 1-like protein